MNNGIADLLKILDKVNLLNKQTKTKDLYHYGDPYLDPLFTTDPAARMNIKTVKPNLTKDPHNQGEMAKLNAELYDLLTQYYAVGGDVKFEEYWPTTYEKPSKNAMRTWKSISNVVRQNPIISYGADPRKYADFKLNNISTTGVTSPNDHFPSFINYDEAVRVAIEGPRVKGFKDKNPDIANIPTGIHEIIHNSLLSLPKEVYPFKNKDEEEDFAYWYSQKLSPNRYDEMNSAIKNSTFSKEKQAYFENIVDELNPIFQKMIKDRRPGGPR